MGLMGTAFGRMLHGAGEMANRYIDQDLAIQRAQALADIQRVSAGKTREDQAAFDDKRAPVVREQRRQDTLAAGAASRESELAGLNDTAYQGAKRAKADEEASDATRRKGAEMDALMPREAKRAGLMAEAQARAQAKFREPRQDASADVLKKVAAIEQVLGRKLSEEEKLAALGLVKGGRDPELDTETVTLEEMQPDGTVKKTQRKQVRKPGQAAPAPSEDPLKAAMDAARAKDKPQAGMQAEPPQSPVMGRPYLRVSTADLNKMLRGKVSSAERQEIMQEIERRKEGDLQ